MGERSPSAAALRDRAERRVRAHLSVLRTHRHCAPNHQIWAGRRPDVSAGLPSDGRPGGRLWAASAVALTLQEPDAGYRLVEGVAVVCG